MKARAGRPRGGGRQHFTFHVRMSSPIVARGGGGSQHPTPPQQRRGLMKAGMASVRPAVGSGR
jgi:hypothetical protein